MAMLSENPWPFKYERVWKQFPSSLTLREHYLRDHCWVCNVEFENNPNAARHDHHIIPRAFGGVNGPQVSLCNAHHDLLHALADAFISGNSLQVEKRLASVEGMPPDAQTKLVWLASRVYIAHQVTSEDPNKKTLVTIPLSQQEVLLLSKLQKQLGLTRPATLKAALMKLAQSQRLIKNS